jgi:cytochrome c2
MVGRVVVMKPAAYEAWLRTGNTTRTMAAAGEQLFRKYGCTGCHGAGSSVRAPMLDGVYGNPVAIQIPQPGVPLEKIEATTTTADDRYIHDSIVLPEQEVAAGFRPIMPTFKGRLKEEEIIQLIDYIKSLGTSNGTSNGLSSGSVQGANSNNITDEDLRTRTGFVAPNAGTITGGGVANGDVTKNVTGNVPTSNTPGAGNAANRNRGGVAGANAIGNASRHAPGSVPAVSGNRESMPQ